MRGRDRRGDRRRTRPTTPAAGGPAMENRSAVGATGIGATALIVAIFSVLGGGGSSARTVQPVVLDGGGAAPAAQSAIVVAADSSAQPGSPAGLRIEIGARAPAASRTVTGHQL